MGISCGIVGLPNVGKSTLFNALTHSQVPAENYPFCTINPNVGIVAVPDHRIDPIHDIQVIDTELMLADLESLEQNLGKTERHVRNHEKQAIARQNFLKRIASELGRGNRAGDVEPAVDEIQFMKEMSLLTAKPIMYLANVSEGELTKNPLLEKMQTYAKHIKTKIITVNAKLEADLAQLENSERADFLSELGLEEPSLPRVINLPIVSWRFKLSILLDLKKFAPGQ